MAILKKIADSGRVVIIVTHSQKVANQCHRVLTIADGIIQSDELLAAIGMSIGIAAFILVSCLSGGFVLRGMYRHPHRGRILLPYRNAGHGSGFACGFTIENCAR